MNLSIAYRMLGNDAGATDCFQERFIAALNFAGRERIENWPELLKKIATMQALQLLRKWGLE